MYKHIVIGWSTLLLLFGPKGLSAQIIDSLSEDSLPPVIITAYEQLRTLKDIPAAVNFISPRTLNSFDPSTVLMAINSTPGIRMEERSPGSYRLNFRGSSLRSTFGVRNIKIYYNDLPFTDPGGNSFFNQLAPGNFHSMEIIKGPGGSAYGSGTGGVMLIHPLNETTNNGLLAEYSIGSFNLHQLTAGFTESGEKARNQIIFQYQKSNGYREHSSMHRKIFTWNGKFVINKNLLSTSFMLGDLFYQTPGALTYNEYIRDPVQARPGTAFSPGAEQNNASIRQRSLLAGASWLQHFSPKFGNKTSVYGMYTMVENPAIRNYGKTSEPHTGLRSVFYFDDSLGKSTINWVTGGEWQVGFPSFETYENSNGAQDSLLWIDGVNNRQNFIFSQLRFSIRSFTIMAGASINLYKTLVQRFSPAPSDIAEKIFRNEWAPRVSLSYQWSKSLIYAGYSRGFSPPSLPELNPSGSDFNAELQPEYGSNYDLGFRTEFENLGLDINAFHLGLNNTIVLQRDSLGGDYYINSGKTGQSGVETALTLSLFRGMKSIHFSKFYLSHTLHAFHFLHKNQSGNDSTGKEIPGVAKHTIAAGMDVELLNGFSTHLHYFFSDRIPLNDANSAYASSYHLLGFKLGYRKTFLKNQFRFYAGCENLLNEKYSLGNDINGFGGRYYNAAPERNFYFSIRWEMKKIKN